ncbi:MAG TPA: YqiA/YcfP family alpha/beta fold hydrolase [Candidatus Melainabacteria bacterium]|nr:YqiA/YcfP family alpha/beta fold hydrolase [Candidatus Melainabacteria bacterium]
MRAKVDTTQLNVFYLHGFGSSPSSQKAVRFKEMLEADGASVEIPDLNFPTFKEMTLSTQLELLENKIQKLPSDIPLVLFGSSMGGLLASLLAQRINTISALVLLAPGFGIARRWKEFVTADEYDRWQQTGEHHFYHHAHDSLMPLGYEFARVMESMQTEDLTVELPCLVFHGLHDTTVPVEESKKFADLNQSVDLRILDDDHQLLNSLEHMLVESRIFLQNHRLVKV